MPHQSLLPQVCVPATRGRLSVILIMFMFIIPLGLSSAKAEEPFGLATAFIIQQKQKLSVSRTKEGK